MKPDISLDRFINNPELVKRYIADSVSKDVARIEFRTFDEGLCDATLFSISKDQVEGEFEALITLLNHQLHFDHEWTMAHADTDNADSILQVWMQPEVMRFSFKELSTAQVHEQMDWIIEAIQRRLVEARESGTMTNDPGRWGVFVNNKPVPIETGLRELGIADAVSGAGLNLEWNSVDVMYQTDKHHVLFSWGTAA